MPPFSQESNVFCIFYLSRLNSRCNYVIRIDCFKISDDCGFEQKRRLILTAVIKRQSLALLHQPVQDQHAFGCGFVADKSRKLVIDFRSKLAIEFAQHMILKLVCTFKTGK